MRQITLRSSIPPELQTLQAHYTPPQKSDWETMHQNHETEYRAVREQLAYDQNYFCIYCEICLDPESVTHSDRGHIEHHKPKSQFTALMFDWDNLMYCCKTPETCGMAKQRNYFSGFIHPYVEPVQDWIRFDEITGVIEPSGTCPQNRFQDVKKSLDILNLNSPGLISKRKGLLRSLIQGIHSLSAEPDALARFKQIACHEDKPFITARLKLLERLIPEG